MFLNCREKSEVKRSSQSEDILCKKTKQSDLQREVWVKTQEPDCFYECLPMYKKLV